jgi:NAD(P)-dependent dehydrogenase (short-subunit alcohol dehydrogenase family)
LQRRALVIGRYSTVDAPQSEEQKRSTWEQQAIKRLGDPEDVTGAVLFLTTDDAALITGQAIVVVGGQYRIG